jgi:hypothetical protein
VELADAIRIAAHLKDAYPRMTLDEPETELFVHEISRLSDVTAALAAADRIIRTSERFPTVAEFRAQYRAVRPHFQRDEPDEIPETTEEAPRESGIPEWVHVWRWHQQATLTERQAANTTSRAPVAERPPVRMRPFPQERHGYADEFTGNARNEKDPPPGAYSMDEYEEIRQQWIEHGAPRAGSVAEALSV